MIGMSQAEYARYAGISAAAVNRSKQLVKHEDGSINAEETDRARSESARSRAKSRIGSDDMSYSEILAELNKARTDNEHLKARERELKLKHINNNVVDRSNAVSVIFRLARQERDSLLGWPSRVASVMAADLGVNPHKMQTTLERYVREHLESLADLNIEFR